jgi:hypothetical protein
MGASRCSDPQVQRNFTSEDLRGGMDQFAAERYPQKLCIRYVSGPRNHLMIERPCVPHPPDDVVIAMPPSRYAVAARVATF